MSKKKLLEFGLKEADAFQKNFKIIFDRLVRGYKSVMGKEPEGLDLLKVKMEEREKAINTTSSICEITSNSTSTGGNSLTLANGVQGQIKIITMVADSGDVEVRPANFANGTGITFGDVGDKVTLIYLTSKWVAMSNVGIVIILGEKNMRVNLI